MKRVISEILKLLTFIDQTVRLSRSSQDDRSVVVAVRAAVGVTGVLGVTGVPTEVLNSNDGDSVEWPRLVKIGEARESSRASSKPILRGMRCENE